MSSSLTPRRTVLLAAAAALAGVPGCGASREALLDDASADHLGQPGVVDGQPSSVILAGFDLIEGAQERAAFGKALSIFRSGQTSGVETTIAAGSTLFRKLGVGDPDGMQRLPGFPGERIDHRSSDGDVIIQVCAGGIDPCRRLVDQYVKESSRILKCRWRQSGFLPAHSEGETPRNLFRFKDGTENPVRSEFPKWVWDDRGGTFLVYRKIHMDVDRFLSLPTDRQENIIGRHRRSGAPLGSEEEKDLVDLFAKTSSGRYVIPVDSHVRLAHSRSDRGARMLRRGYSYDAGGGDQGLLFIAFMRDPALFVRVQQRLAGADAMNEFIEHRASAVGYVLPVAVLERFRNGDFGD
ncbi:Dyp-type peroxidase [Streptomyces sp. NPDC006879]|uniref:Dyp-type peroxidase n=1 Tax=Streptomyces sp. NPDC006879 TaxID=3364767 RepID=UPI0036CA6FF4